jgi:uncharacterized protein (TIGR02466 family)
MNIAPLFMMGVGVSDATPNLEFARSLFDKYADDIGPVDGSDGLRTTLKDYVGVATQTDGVKQDVISSDLGDLLVNESVAYLQAQGFDTDQHNYELQNVWLNEMTSGSNHRKHSHSGYHVSGCMYVDLPDDSASIGFEGFLERFDRNVLPHREFTAYNSATWTLNPSEGQVICWNSYLRHFVNPQMFNGVRRTIAFDISATGKKENS